MIAIAASLVIGLFTPGPQWGDVVSLAGNPQGVFEMVEDPDSVDPDLGFLIRVYWTDGAVCLVRFEERDGRTRGAPVRWVERRGGTPVASGTGLVTASDDNLRIDFTQEGAVPETFGVVLRLRGDGLAPRAPAGQSFTDGRRSVSGTYAITTIWGDPIGTIVLREGADGFVTGTLRDRRGGSVQIEGTVQARHLRGRWFSGSEEGEIDLAVEDGGSIHGSWTRAYEADTFFRGMRTP